MMRVREKVILKGWHYPINPFIRVLKDRYQISGKARFKSVWYEKLHVDDYDLNKLIGISMDFKNRRSIRIAWAPSKFENEVVLYSYIHDGTDSRPKPEYLATVKQFNWFEYEIHILPMGKAMFRINNETRIVDFDSPDSYIGYMQSPYFGGDNPAPRTLCIDFDRPETGGKEFRDVTVPKWQLE